MLLINWFPNTLQNIGADAFRGCNNLKCGCVQISTELREQAIHSGINQYVITNKCLNSECIVNFGKKSCNYYNYKKSAYVDFDFHIYPSLFYFLLNHLVHVEK